MTASNGQPRSVTVSPTTEITTSAPAGRWYYVVTLVSAGCLAWVPFAHAASKLRRQSDVRRTIGYVVAAAILMVLGMLAPTDPATGQVSVDGDPIGLACGMLALIVMAVACVQQTRLRREVYGGAEARPVVQAPAAATMSSTASVPDGTDPAVAAVLAARERRDKARELAASDPLMARELCIGRPDLDSDYDDGGLVDLNSAPASAIAEVCQLGAATAERIVEARTARGGFLAVDDVFVAVEVPLNAWELVRDRAVVIPR